jgi:hypothetical protein
MSIDNPFLEDRRRVVDYRKLHCGIRHCFEGAAQFHGQQRASSEQRLFIGCCRESGLEERCTLTNGERAPSISHSTSTRELLGDAAGLAGSVRERSLVFFDVAAFVLKFYCDRLEAG